MTRQGRTIPKFENLYMVSNLGEVKSLRRNIILIPQENDYGYFTVILYKDKKRRYVGIHRLVLEGFVRISKKPINHKDGNKKNNKLYNLEYCTTKQNMRHAWKLGLYKKRYEFEVNGCRLSNKDVLKIKKLLKQNFTQSEIAKKFKVDPSLISLIKNGKRRTHLGKV